MGLAPQNCVLTTHGSFAGYYKSIYSRQESRSILGISQDAIVFGAIGQVRRYKGLDLAASALTRIIQSRRDVYFLIAGEARGENAALLSSLMNSCPNLIVKNSFIPDDKLHIYYNAIDFSLYTYERITTSGSVMSSIDFRTPVIAELNSATEGLAEMLGSNLLFRERTLSDVVKAVKVALGLNPCEIDGIRKKMSVFSKANDWYSVSRLILGVLSDQEKLDQIESKNNVKIVNKHKLSFAASKALGICIVNYKCLPDIANNLECLSRQSYKDFQVCIVDNGSDPDCSIDSQFNFPVSYLSLEQNGGYAVGVNSGIEFLRLSGCETILVLNPDMQCAETAIEELLRSYCISDHDIMSPVISFCDDKRQVWYGGGKLNFLKPSISADNMYYRMDIGDIPPGVRDTDFISGAAFIARASVYSKAGPLPTSFFLYFEETQWSIEAKKKGLKLAVVNIQGFNHVKKSSGTLPRPYYLYYYSRSYLVFFMKNAGVGIDHAFAILHSNFGGPWLEKVRYHEPSFLSFYSAIYELARSDARQIAFSADLSGSSDALQAYTNAFQLDPASFCNVSASYQFYAIKIAFDLKANHILAPFSITAKVKDVSYEIEFPSFGSSIGEVKQQKSDSSVYKCFGYIPVLVIRDILAPGTHLFSLSLYLGSRLIESIAVDARDIVADLRNPVLARINNVDENGFLEAWSGQNKQC
jgi:GT2 family glycosyltransferase